ncbi:MAG TPA: hypothetical protein EYG70_06900 [Sulfurimonas sp.]|nr:hypothetical protein [Sulfurimonas sp.]
MQKSVTAFFNKIKHNEDFTEFEEKLKDENLEIQSVRKQSTTTLNGQILTVYEAYLADGTELEVKVNNKGIIRGIIYEDVVILDIDDSLKSLPRKAIEIIKISTKQRLQKARQKDMKALSNVEDILEDSKEDIIKALKAEIIELKKSIKIKKLGV